jgi:uncharacterized coiled-coil protein SlyX
MAKFILCSLSLRVILLLILFCSKEDLQSRLADMEAKLAEAQEKASELSGTLERYRTDHLRSAEALRNDILQVLEQCNLEAPPV